MNILFFMNCYPDSRNGGIENVTRLLSQDFVGKGIKVHIRYLLDIGFQHTNDSIYESCERLSEPQIHDKIAKDIQEYAIDIIINRCVIFASPIIREAINGTGCKLITTYNNKPTLDPPTLSEVLNRQDTAIMKRLAMVICYPVFRTRSIHNLRRRHQRSYEASDYTVLLSSRYIQEYTLLMQIDSTKLVVINNPIKDGVEISDSELSKKEKIVLMVTRLDESQKCVIKALKIWSHFTQEVKDWKLLIVGSGPDEKRIKGYATENNVQNVEFIPACDPIEYYKRASIFLMTSRNEGWPNTINEAMRLGCVPVVIASFSAIYDMVDDGKNGFLITEGPDELNDSEKALKILTSSKETRMTMSLDAIEKTRRLSIDTIANEWIALFENLKNNKQ